MTAPQTNRTHQIARDVRLSDKTPGQVVSSVNWSWAQCCSLLLVPRTSGFLLGFVSPPCPPRPPLPPAALRSRVCLLTQGASSQRTAICAAVTRAGVWGVVYQLSATLSRSRDGVQRKESRGGPGLSTQQAAAQKLLSTDAVPRAAGCSCSGSWVP